MPSEHGPKQSVKVVVSGDPWEARDVPSNNEISLGADGPLSDGDRHKPSLDKSLTDTRPVTSHRVIERHRVRTSLPPSDQLVVGMIQKRQQEVDERKLDQEYELKAQ
jgi:hypothetical protein